MTTFRPELHLTAEEGILEGPAGVIRLGAKNEHVWQMFYQYRPTPDGQSRWGHSMSEGDPFSWYECNDAIVPAGGERHLRAGAVVGGDAQDGGIDIYFTSRTDAGSTVQVARVDDVDALCTDLDDDTVEVSTVVQRLGKVVESTDEFSNFRSPCVIPGWNRLSDRNAGHEGWLMLAVTGHVDNPQPVVLSSDDGRGWQFIGPLEFVGDGEHEPAFVTGVAVA